MTKITTWQPIDHLVLENGLEIHADEIAMTIGRGQLALATHAWPGDGARYSLCRAVEREVDAIPEEVRGALRTCPFCAGEAVVGSFDNDRDTWSVFCDGPDANCRAKTQSSDSQEDAIATWNRRVTRPGQGA